MGFEPKDQKSDIEELIKKINELQAFDVALEDSKRIVEGHEDKGEKAPQQRSDSIIDESVFDSVKKEKQERYASKEKSAIRRLLDEDEDDNDESEEPELQRFLRSEDYTQVEDIEDFESESERDEIYRDLKNTVGKMAVKTVAFFLISLFSIVLFFVGFNAQRFGINVQSVWFHLIWLAMDAACAVLSFGIFTQGLVRLLRFKADTDTLLALFFVFLTILRITSLFVSDLREYRMYLEPMLAIGLYFNVLSKKRIASNIKKNFKMIAASGDKLTAGSQPNCEVKNDLILETGEGGEVLFVHKTGLVSQYIEHSYSDFDCDRNLYRFLCASIALILVGTIAVLQLTGWKEALMFPAAAFALSVPFFSRFYYATSIYKNGQKTRKNGGVLTSVASAKSIVDADLFIVREEDFMGKDAVLLQGVKALGTMQIDVLITYIAALYDKVGTPLKPLFLKMIDQKSVDLPKVHFEEYEEGLGHSCMIESRPLIVGSWEYMQKHHVDFPEQLSRLQLKGCHFPVYVAYNNKPAGIFIASYERNPSTERAVELIVDAQVSVAFPSNNHLFNLELLKSLYPEANETSFHFLTKKTGKACAMFLKKVEKAPDCIASKRGFQGLAACRYSAAKLLSAIKVNRFIRIAYCVMSLALILFIALAGYSDDTALQIFVFQTIWTATVSIVCAFCK